MTSSNQGGWQPPPPPPEFPVFQSKTKTATYGTGDGGGVVKKEKESLLRPNPHDERLKTGYGARKGMLYNPVILLLFFTVCNLLNYLDRGAMGSLVATIADPKEFDLSFFERGVLGGCFMFGFMIFSPLFAYLSKTYSSTKLMTIGLSVWVLAAVGCGASVEFYTLAAARTVIGIGEASFAALAPVYIDDIAPYYRRTMWLSCFFSATPVGAALGYIAGGIFSGEDDAELKTDLNSLDWRYLFYGEAVLMVPFVIICFFIPMSKDVVFKQDPDNDNPPDSVKPQKKDEKSFGESLKVLASNDGYTTTVLGYSAFIFVVGALSYWCPNYLQEQLDQTPFNAGLGVGIVTVVAGLMGTACGGLLLDKLGGSQGQEGAARALKLSFCCACVCFPTAFLAFLFDNLWTFYIFVLIGQFFLFAATAPINGALLSMVPDDLRSFAMGVCIFFIHLIGDFPSPILVGQIIDLFSIRIGLLFPCCWLIFAVSFLLSGWIVVRSPNFPMAVSKTKLIAEKSDIL